MITQEEILSSFYFMHGQSVIVFPGDGLGVRIADPDARRVLSAISLPPNGLAEYIEFSRGNLKSVSSVLPRHDPMILRDADDLHVFGTCWSYLLCIHGRTGCVYLVDDENQAVSLLSTGLDAFLKILAFLSRERNHLEEAPIETWKNAPLIADIITGSRQRAIDKVREVDPTGFDTASGTWTELIHSVLDDDPD